jgi:transcriptional regulator with XRE-family HTH domain
MSSKIFTDSKLFSKRLAILIDDKLKISRSEFADNVHISKPYLSKILAGTVGPSAELIAGMHMSYRKHLHWALTGEAEKSAETGDKTVEHEELIDILGMAEKLLNTDDRCSRVLAELIRCMYASRRKQEYFSDLETRIASLESRNKKKKTISDTAFRATLEKTKGGSLRQGNIIFLNLPGGM